MKPQERLFIALCAAAHGEPEIKNEAVHIVHEAFSAEHMQERMVEHMRRAKQIADLKQLIEEVKYTYRSSQATLPVDMQFAIAQKLKKLEEKLKEKEMV